VKTVIALLANA